METPLPLLHAIAVADFHQAVPIVVAAGMALGGAANGTGANYVIRLNSRRHQLAPLLPWLYEHQCSQLLAPMGACCLSLAASLGHSAVLGALLAAGVCPNPHDPEGRSIWHPLAAAAMSANDFVRSDAQASEETALEMCQQLLTAGADLACCVRTLSTVRQWRPHRWLLQIESQAIQQLLLGQLAACSQQGTLRPTFQLTGVLVQMAAAADDADACRHFAAALPLGRLPAEYRQIAEEAVAAACSCPAHCQVLRCMAEPGSAGAEEQQQQQPGGAEAAAAAAAAAHPLAGHVWDELAASLAAAAQEGHLQQLLLLLTAGVLVTSAAVRGAVWGGCPAALAVLLQFGAPPAEQLPAGTVLFVPQTDAGQYTCPMHVLLAAHADLGFEPLHPDGIAMAECLAAAGYSPTVYCHVAVHREGDEEARVEASRDPVLQDADMAAHTQGGGRYL